MLQLLASGYVQFVQKGWARFSASPSKANAKESMQETVAMVQILFSLHHVRDNG